MDTSNQAQTIRNNDNLTHTEESIFQAARQYLGARDNEAHTLIVVDFALRLMMLYEADRSVVIPAAILHDVGWSRVPEEIRLRAYGPWAEKSLTRVHEREGAKISEAILKGVGYDAIAAAKIAAIIEGHDTRSDPLSMEDQIVKDADKLSRFSRAGFAARTKEFGITDAQNYVRLENCLEEWLFLPGSKTMARKELADRLVEMAHPL